MAHFQKATFTTLSRRRPQVVTTLQKRPWDEFANRRGDWGRDLALLLRRTRGGLTLRELGQETGMKPHAVSKAIM